MIFRDKDGNLLNINRKSYYTESEYYNKFYLCICIVNFLQVTSYIIGYVDD